MPIICKYLLILLILLVNFETFLPLLLPLSALIALELIICFPLIKNKNKKVYNDFSGYMYLCSHLLLQIFTFGIWEIMWISKTTKFINRVSKDKISVAASILLCLFVPYYFVAWNHEVAVRLDKYACDNKVASNIAPTCTFLSFFDNIAVSVLIQAKINETVYVAVKNQKITEEDSEISNAYMHNVRLKFNLILHAVLLLVTGGVWQYIWIYKFTNRLNAVSDKEHFSALGNLFLCLFVPFYIIVWNYKMAKRLGEHHEEAYMDSDIVSTTMVSSFIAPNLAPVLLQYKLNSLCSR